MGKLFFIKIMRDQEGMALLITLMVVSLLTAITAHFGLLVRHEIVASTHAKDRSLMQAATRSGLQWGMAAIAKDGKDNTFDSSYDVWAELGGDGNDVDEGDDGGEGGEGGVDFNSLFPQTGLTITIIDLGRKLQLNSLAESQNVDLKVAKRSQAILRDLLMTGKFAIKDDEHASEVVESIADWIDNNDLEHNRGGESTYYLSLQPPYEAKDDSIECIDELLLIKGIDERLLYGDETEEYEALADYVTAHGDDGKININTAAPLLLQVLSEGVNAEMAAKMAKYRGNEDHEASLAQPEWYKQVSGMAGVNIEEDVITTQSSFFRIETIGKVYEMEKKMVAVVKRDEDGNVILLSKKVD